MSSIPPDVVALSDYARHAHARMTPQAWAYVSGGAGDEVTLHHNPQAWQGWQILPRVLRATAGGHTRVDLLGRTCPHPILLAPVAHQCLAHPDGEKATACAAAAQGAGLVLSTQASVSLESVAALMKDEPERGPLWFQLYLQPDRGFTRELVQRAEQAGYEALVLTVDAPVSGARDRERRAGFALPVGVSSVNLAGMTSPGARPLSAGQSALFGDLLHHAPTWADVQWLQGITHLPIVLKGILHPDDARQAASLGVAGLIVSNHGGRTLDTTPATATMLPRVAQAVGGQLMLIVDGGIRRGTDVFKALALGADAVMVGRPYVYALAAAGALGVAHAIRLLRDELEIAMALSGCATLDQITPDALIPTAHSA
ncbi:MAG TPA: alpha-hydroxy acid oxidase [Aquabacterium sp.]|nr:alpha-hydroxy acid oxidase [Aquabacterium sp.]HRH27519.1 alpha-hydroxy acid oxidase [Aquabacterium sp.]